MNILQHWEINIVQPWFGVVYLSLPSSEFSTLTDMFFMEFPFIPSFFLILSNIIICPELDQTTYSSLSFHFDSSVVLHDRCMTLSAQALKFIVLQHSMLISWDKSISQNA